MSSLELARSRFGQLKKLSKELGFDDFGVASLDGGTPYGSLFDLAISEGRLSALDYMERTRKERSDVLELMPEAKSVIVVIKNYFNGHHEEFLEEGSQEKPLKIARYAWGRDYHQWFKKRLQKMRHFIHENYGQDRKVHIFNDTGPVLERGFAEKAGLGFIGKSAMFIHRDYGTWTLIGGAVTDLPLEAYDGPKMRDLCGSCTRCMDACPTQAILSPRKVSANKCISTYNIERPNHPEADKVLKGKEWGLGCDICQEVCPWNKFEQKTSEPRFAADPDHVFLTKALLEKDLRGTVFARPKKEGLQMALDRYYGLNTESS